MVISPTPFPLSRQPAADTGPSEPLERLGTALSLMRAARRAETPAILAHVIVNETVRFVAYRQAVLWTANVAGGVRVRAVSGVDQPDPHSPFVQYLGHLIRHLNRAGKTAGPRPVAAAEIPTKWCDQWHRWSAGQMFWCPWSAPGTAAAAGGVLFFRDTPWTDAAMALLADLNDAYGHAWHAQAGRRGDRRRIWSWPVLGALLAAGLLMALPVRMSALAPMTIAPKDPLIVSAPMDGVLATAAVSPNQTVAAGQTLFQLDDTSLRNRLAVAQKSLEIVQADYQRATQKAFGDAQSRSELLLLKAQVEEKAAEMDWVAAMLARSCISAPKDGIAVFTDANDWIGKPVVTGEKIMTIADPARVEADIRLPVADAISLEPGALVRLFLDVQPHRPLPAVLRSASYEAEPTDAGVLAFRLKADLETGQTPRIGLRGTAKVYGRPVPLGYYLFRRPLAAARRLLGI